MDHELLIAKIRLKLKKVEKTNRQFRYDLKQIPYDYTVEVRNRLKGLDLIDRVPDELWTEVHDMVQEKGAVAPQETNPYLPMSIQESLVEAWVSSSLPRCWMWH